MKIKQFFAVLFIGGLSLLSCSDDDSKNNSCEDNNEGFLKINIPESDFRTAFVFTEVGSETSFERIVEPNKTTATLDLEVGIYTVAADQINADGEAVSETAILNIQIEKCETVERNIEF